MIAVRKDLEGFTSIWLHQVQPCKLVELFWQSHSLNTTKYCDDCQAIFGEVIKFTGPFEPLNKNSSVSEQHNLLFQFEQNYLKHNLFCCEQCRVSNEECESSEDLKTTRQILFDTFLDMDTLANKIEDVRDGDWSCNCFGNCCAFCCEEANNFTYNPDCSED